MATTIGNERITLIYFAVRRLQFGKAARAQYSASLIQSLGRGFHFGFINEMMELRRLVEAISAVPI
jgi:hypothetical protein